MLSADNAGPDVLVLCPFAESMDTVVFVNEHRMPSSNGTDAHAHLNLCCWHKVQ